MHCRNAKNNFFSCSLGYHLFKNYRLSPFISSVFQKRLITGKCVQKFGKKQTFLKNVSCRRHESSDFLPFFLKDYLFLCEILNIVYYLEDIKFLSLINNLGLTILQGACKKSKILCKKKFY